MKTKNDNMPKIFLLTLGHFLNDIHGNFLSTFMPSIIENLGLSLTQGGVLASLSGVIHVVLQPFLGYHSDKQTKPVMIMAGPVIAAFGASMLPIASNYGTAFLLVGTWGMGSALFHPQGLGSVGYISSPEHISFDISLFQVGGALGMTMSSLYAMFLINTVGKRYMPLVCLIPVSILAILYYIYIPRIPGHKDKGKSQDTGFLRTVLGVFAQIWPIWSVAFSRDLATQSIRFLIPILIATRGGSIARIGMVLFMLNLARSVLTMVIGRMSDLFGKKPVLLITLAVSPPLLVFSILSDGMLSLALLVAGFSLVGCSPPITAGTAQELAPEARSTASSLIMGVSFGLSGMMLTLIGALADTFGIKATMLFVVLLPYISVIIILTKWKEASADKR